MRHVDAFENEYVIRSAIDDKNSEQERRKSGNSRDTTVLNTVVSNFLRMYLFFP